MEKGDRVELKIEDIDVNGNGISHYEGKTVFVHGGLPGEEITAEIIKDKKKLAVARIISVNNETGTRRVPPCRYYKKCGGCNIMHASYPLQLDIKHKHVSDCISRIAKLNCDVFYPIPSPEEFRCRNKASFPLEMSDGILKTGFYRSRSHEICSVDDCMMQNDIVALLMGQVKAWIVSDGLSIYDEKEHKGLIRHIVVRVTSLNEIMLTIVINSSKAPDINGLLKRCEYVIPNLKSIVFSHNTEKGNVILGTTETVAYGNGYVKEKICGLDFMVSAHSFLQVNHGGMELLYNTVIKFADIRKDQVVADLYCGIGTISLLAALKAKKVYGIEIIEDAVKDAEANAQINDMQNAEFICGDVHEVFSYILDKEDHIDTIIVDPPRKGLNEGVVEDIALAEPDKIIYVSCDPATLARDLYIFDQKGYCINFVQPVDMFPDTMHVETVVLMSKVKE